MSKKVNLSELANRERVARLESVIYISDMLRCNLGTLCSKHQTHDVFELEDQLQNNSSKEEK